MEHETTIFGIRAVIEAIKSGENIDKIFLQKGLRGELFTELEQLLHKERLYSCYVPVVYLWRKLPLLVSILLKNW